MRSTTGKRLSVVGLAHILSLLSGCFSGVMPLWGPPEGGPPQYFFTPHIEDVTVPPDVRANVPVTIDLDLSADASPNFFLTGGTLYYLSTAPGFEQGVEEGRFVPGKFLGLFANTPFPPQNRVSLGPLQANVSVPITFTQAGRQVLYFGHARQRQDGGSAMGRTGNDYPAESDVIEYLKIIVDVQP